MILAEAVKIIEDIREYSQELARNWPKNIQIPHTQENIDKALETLVSHAKQPVQVTDEMVEMVADFMWKKDYPCGDDPYFTWESIPDNDRDKNAYRIQAKAALQAALGVK